MLKKDRLFTAVFITFSCNIIEALAAENGTLKTVRIGVIVDKDSSVGDMGKRYIDAALSEFYARHSNYRTRLNPSVKDSMNDVVVAASRAIELMNDEGVHAIIGPQKSSQAKFIVKLAEKKKVPVISFSATSPSLSPDYGHFFFRANQDDSAQVKAITSIVQIHGWREVVVIYEDTEYGNGLIPYLTDAFEEIEARISYRSAVPPSPNHQLRIAKELSKIMARETRVLLVHMTASLGSELFRQAAEAGMMSEGFAWIVTDGMSTLLDPIVSDVFGSMQGVLGVRPYVPSSKGLRGFKRRWKRRVILNNMLAKSTEKARLRSEISLFGLWAYDTVWALARAVEFVSRTNPLAFKPKEVRNNACEESLLGLKVDSGHSGLMLVKALESTSFEGLSGEFSFARRRLQPVEYEIVNFVGARERVIGFWSAEKGLRPRSGKSGADSSAGLMEDRLVEQISWPGSAKFPPKGWVIPITGHKLKVGIPITTTQKFIRIEWDPRMNEPRVVSGFSYEIFMAALDALPFAISCEFIPHELNGSRFMAGTYNDLVYHVKLKKYDAAIGDITILANRTSYVDFTLPYMEAGVSMVVKMKDDKRDNNMWIFLKPLSWDLWLTIGGGFVFTGFVVWVFEHPRNSEFGGPLEQQLGTMFWFSFSTLVFAHREKVVNNWSRFVLIIWIFVVLILTQSYTASLASMLTVQRLQPAVFDIEELKRNGDFVGYDSHSFVREFLTDRLKFDETKLRAYSSPDEYLEALSKGSKRGGVSAIFDEIPYLGPLLAKHCGKYTMVGPTYKSDGFGFAFPLGSPLVSYISRAILNVTEDHTKMRELEQKYFGDLTTCKDQSSQLSSNGPSLGVRSFAGLFIITGIASGSSCLIYLIKLRRENRFWSRVTEMKKRSDNNSVPLSDLNNKDELPTNEAKVISIDESNHQNLSASNHSTDEHSENR